MTRRNRDRRTRNAENHHAERRNAEVPNGEARTARTGSPGPVRDSGPGPARRGPSGEAPETTAVRAGRGRNGGALAPILWATSAFEVPPATRAAAWPPPRGRRPSTPATATRPCGRSRTRSPSSKAPRPRLAFASGMGAVSAVVLGLCGRGGHIVAQRQMYGGTLQLLGGLPRFGIDVTLVDATRPGAFAEAVEPGRTVLALAETPANPCLDLVDLDELGGLVGPITVVDSTFATPLAQRPLDHGVDLVRPLGHQGAGRPQRRLPGRSPGARESSTGSGASPCCRARTPRPSTPSTACAACARSGSGCASSRPPRWRWRRRWRRTRRCAGCATPASTPHPQAELARRQLRHFGGLVTFDLAGGEPAAQAFLEALDLCRVAPSLGGPETLVGHPASSSHASLLPDELEACGISAGTIRLSAGLEDTDDVAADLRRGLEAASLAAGRPAGGADRDVEQGDLVEPLLSGPAPGPRSTRSATAVDARVGRQVDDQRDVVADRGAGLVDPRGPRTHLDVGDPFQQVVGQEAEVDVEGPGAMALVEVGGPGLGAERLAEEAW